VNDTTSSSPAREQPLFVPLELWIASTLGLILSYFLFSENGALLTQHWELLHEFFHDSRHAIGVPCH